MAVWYLPAFRDWLIELVGELAHYAVEGEAAQTDAPETGPDAVVEAVPEPTADLEPVRPGEPMEDGFARFFPHGSDPEVLPKPVVSRIPAWVRPMPYPAELWHPPIDLILTLRGETGRVRAELEIPAMGPFMAARAVTWVGMFGPLLLMPRPLDPLLLPVLDGT